MVKTLKHVDVVMLPVNILLQRTSSKSQRRACMHALCGIGEIIMRLDIQVTVRIARGESICSLLASSLVQIGKYYITLWRLRPAIARTHRSGLLTSFSVWIYFNFLWYYRI